MVFIKDKLGFAMSFGWMFAIIVGAAILFIAVFFAMNLIQTSSYEVNTKTSQDLINILDPLQTASEDAKSDLLKLTQETRIYTSCNEAGEFGENKIQISEKINLLGDEWSSPGGRIPSSKNQYVFSENLIQTNENKELYFLIMPIEMPYKTADILIWHTEKYCFVNAPDKIERTIRALRNEEGTNFQIETSVSNCDDDSISVCFSSGSCEIVVEDSCNGINCEAYDIGFVEKDNDRLFYVDNLLYAAIFSSHENYECGVTRVVKRLNYLSEIYREKSKFVSNRCGTGVTENLNQMVSVTENYKELRDLINIKLISNEIESKNRLAKCRLY